MRKIIKKIIGVILWIGGFPIIVILFGICGWITCFIDFIYDD